MGYWCYCNNWFNIHCVISLENVFKLFNIIIAMALRNKKVAMNADKDFFDKLFEPSRKKIEKQLGTKVSQVNFTKMIFKSGLKLDINLRRVKKNVKKK